jgi:hypothetical protein
MDYQDVTIELPADVLREAKHLAVDQGLSLPRFVATIVEAHLAANYGFRAARERQRRLLHSGLELGTGGHLVSTRSVPDSEQKSP